MKVQTLKNETVLFYVHRWHSQFTGQRAGDAKTGKGAYWEFR